MQLKKSLGEDAVQAEVVSHQAFLGQVQVRGGGGGGREEEEEEEEVATRKPHDGDGGGGHCFSLSLSFSLNQFRLFFLTAGGRAKKIHIVRSLAEKREEKSVRFIFVIPTKREAPPAASGVGK